MGKELEEELEEKERYCPQCWRTLPPDVTHCPSCGSKAEIRYQEAPSSGPSRVGRGLVTIAGFTLLINGIANFGAAYAVSFFLGSGASMNVSGNVRQSIAMQVLMLLIMAIISIVGSAYGWDVGLHPWRKQNLRSTIMKITFVIFVGFLNVIEGIVLSDTLGFGPLIMRIASLSIILSLGGLVLTILT